MRMGHNGIIGKSGKWYECEFWHHSETRRKYPHEEPFVSCRNSSLANCMVPPNKKQFEVVMSWCTQHELIFEDVCDGPEWTKYLP